MEAQGQAGTIYAKVVSETGKTLAGVSMYKGIACVGCEKRPEGRLKEDSGRWDVDLLSLASCLESQKIPPPSDTHSLSCQPPGKSLSRLDQCWLSFFTFAPQPVVQVSGCCSVVTGAAASAQSAGSNAVAGHAINDLTAGSIRVSQHHANRGRLAGMAQVWSKPIAST